MSSSIEEGTCTNCPSNIKWGTISITTTLEPRNSRGRLVAVILNLQFSPDDSKGTKLPLQHWDISLYLHILIHLLYPHIPIGLFHHGRRTLLSR